MNDWEYFTMKHVLATCAPEGWSFCSCGARTGPLMTFTRQREWHRAHKREIAESKWRRFRWLDRRSDGKRRQ